MEKTHKSSYPWSFMVFLILTMAVPRLYSLVNAYWVGRISMHAPAVSEQYEFLALLLEIIHETVSVGVLALVARTFFGGQTKDSVEVWKAGFVLALGMAGAVAATVFFATNSFAAAVGTPLEILEETLIFLRLRALGIPIEACALVGLAALKSLRRGRLVLLLAFVSVACNIVFDLFLLSDFPFSLRLGLIGSAIAFLGAQIILLASSSAMLLKTTGTTLARFISSPWRRHVYPLFSVGGWSGAESLVRNVGYIGVLFLLNGMGTNEYGGYGIAMNMVWTALIPVLAVAEGTNVLVGNLLGAGEVRSIPRAVAVSSLLSAAYMTGMTLLGLAGGDAAATMFTMNPEMAAFSRTTFVFLCVPFILMAVSQQMKSVFYGTGRTRPIFVLSLVLNCGMTLPFYLAAKHGILETSFLNVMLYFIAVFIADILFTAVFGARTMKGLREEHAS